MAPKAKIHCDECETWTAVEGTTDYVRCDCGQVFAVTITQIIASAP